MPKSKRSKLVTLSQTDKKGKESKHKLFDEVRSALDKYQYFWVLKMNDIRTPVLQDIRSDWGQESKLILGKKKVIQKALGETPEEEYQQNSSEIVRFLQKLPGLTPGLLFTDESPDTVKEYFKAYTKKDFSRVNTKSPIRFEIPEGIVYSRGGQIPEEEDVVMSHSLEETLRNKYKIPTKIKSGKIILEKPYLVCDKGDVLDVRQALILKQFGVALSEFKVPLLAYYDKSSGAAEALNVETTE
ncbi:MRT4 [Candida oxycetoniae]|uniref:Ribosome assembly factor mrt4 n=1 Tax=Candida oxycetoniae TaxID=497107 RepID=A0AAI9SXU6_9ASCO|nr:MRT4 [Candida oxycetoniae]KAI3404987.1 MRT4 [Candida oxycetoniae]